MERKVGEIFEYNGEWYQCVDIGFTCADCDIRNNCSNIPIGACSAGLRKDGKQVRFKKLEKVGEPIRIENKSYQKIKVSDALCNNCAFYDNFSRDCKLNGYINPYPTYSCLINEMFVEIKQNKENMEEREYSEEDMKNNPRFKHHKNIEQVINMQKMKPFDLEAAKAGRPVCTRDGRKARIICFDLNNKNFPIVAIINCDTEENAYQYDIDGVCDEHDNNLNLMMSPEKKEGWVNLCKNNYGDTLAVGVFPNREEAVSNCPPSYLCTIKIEWEE